MARDRSREKSRRQKAGLDFDMRQDKGGEQAIRLAIGKRLRTYYDQIVDQPVPDRFIELLKQLEDKETGKKPE